jgi:hypothetical protein
MASFFIGHNIVGILALHIIPNAWFLKMYDYRGRGGEDSADLTQSVAS